MCGDGNEERAGTASAWSAPDTLQTILASGGPQDIAEALDAIASSPDAPQSPALVAMLAAAREIVAHWRSDSGELDERWAEYQRAAQAETETRGNLMVVLRAIAQLITAGSADQPLPPPAARGGSLDERAASASGDGATGGRIRTVARDADVTACLLGAFRLFRSGQVVESWPGATAARMICYLLASRGHAAHREVLMALFWPDVDPEQARRNLHQTIYVIRKVMRFQRSSPDYVIYQNDSYLINPQVRLWCDAEQFEAQVTAGRHAERLQRADDAIAGCRALRRRLPGGPALRATAERDRLRLLHLDSVNHLAELRFARGEVDVALELTEGVLRREPCDEVAHRRALRCHAATGNRALVVRHFRRYAETMRDLLGLPPSPETNDLYTSLVKS